LPWALWPASNMDREGNMYSANPPNNSPYQPSISKPYVLSPSSPSSLPLSTTTPLPPPPLVQPITPRSASRPPPAAAARSRAPLRAAATCRPCPRVASYGRLHAPSCGPAVACHWGWSASLPMPVAPNPNASRRRWGRRLKFVAPTFSKKCRQKKCWQQTILNNVDEKLLGKWQDFRKILTKNCWHYFQKMMIKIL
jgi:hypothetical protein